MFTRRRVLTQSAAEDINEGVEVLGSIPPFGRLPLPLNWDEGEVQVVLRPEIVNTEAAESEAEAAAIMQMCEAAHRWSICIAGNSAVKPRLGTAVDICKICPLLSLQILG
jgi:hypothetical protein